MKEEEGKMASTRKTSAPKRSTRTALFKTGTLKPGTIVKVAFGTQKLDAKVLRELHGRVTVEISLQDVEDPILTSYPLSEIESSTLSGSSFGQDQL
ncbi:hypothetical protein [Arthrobacter sp. AZCC_0090]|uniref:hypothetical protein n=1 Tax=Arthrobacter sp. AZCC_0090 TaxID=2735881 RepID=UPI0016132C19|nr:hypothetical protein [Arthrobacter sp. AZCC_0090]MBB6406178.1 hypothetical protein [Arthrobacter sp. AZCC_0090]